MSDGTNDSDKTPDKSKDKGKGKGKKSPLMLVLLLFVGIAGGFGVSKVMGGGNAGAEPVEPPPEPGEVAPIEAMNVNLAGGHFLRIAVGAQLTVEVTVKGEEWGKTEGAKVRDVMIDIFSGRNMAELGTPEGRAAAVAELKERSIEATEKEVMDIYLTEFVMQ